MVVIGERRDRVGSLRFLPTRPSPGWDYRATIHVLPGRYLDATQPRSRAATKPYTPEAIRRNR